MKWITRENAAVDRTACPWLIRKFVDHDAEFLFVPPADVRRVAAETGATPYDVEGAELGHVDGRCSFESVLLKYGLEDPGLRRMAAIVHAADISGEPGGSPEGPGLKAIAEGFRQVHGLDDQSKLRATAPVYDALYAYCSRPPA